ncbi:transposase [Bdellovibrio sp. GT3]|uniref:transposase n=1 Tax=Bdellovibrio sp. GT3 TaxID=3136282 RepID=UPI00403FFF2F
MIPLSVFPLYGHLPLLSQHNHSSHQPQTCITLSTSRGYRSSSQGDSMKNVFKPFDLPKNHKLSYGGALRNSSFGRGTRPLSNKKPIHLVLKINKFTMRGGLRNPHVFRLMNILLKRYSLKFFVKIEQVSIQNDHVHLLIRASRRSRLQSFFRVVPGQFAQRLTDTPMRGRESVRIWKHRPFTRVVKGFRAYRTVRNYIQLNECEANGRPYSKTRLRGMSEQQIHELWTGEYSRPRRRT